MVLLSFSTLFVIRVCSCGSLSDDAKLAYIRKRSQLEQRWFITSLIGSSRSVLRNNRRSTLRDIARIDLQSIGNKFGGCLIERAFLT